MSARRTAALVRHRVIGIAYIGVIAAFLASTVLVYQKAFTPVVHVLLRADHVGNQLQPPSDVKVRGVVVGEVRRVRASARGSELDLALQPDKVELIPRNVSARLLPKTLFGERYVSLVPPGGPRQEPLVNGDVISQDRSRTSIELEKVFSDLMPLLQAVQPQKLATTLNTVSMVLDGRGGQLGRTLVELNRYLEGINPSLPDLEANIRALADVSRTYATAAPDLAQALSDMSVNTRTVAEQRANLDRLYRTVTTSSLDTAQFLRANKDNLIALNAASRPGNELFARYAPEYPCLLRDLAESIPETDRVAGKGTDEPGVVHLTVEASVSRGKYVPGQDAPRYADQRGPRCYDATRGGPQYPPDGPFRDGSTHPPPPERTRSRGPSAPPAPTTPSAALGSSVGPSGSVVNSPAEQRLVALLLAPSLQREPKQVPEWSTLLVGPLFRGAEVTVR